MKKFLAIFTCAENSNNHEAWKKLDANIQEERMKNGMSSLEKWEQTYKNQIIFDGGSLGKNTKKINNEGIHDIPSGMGNFKIVEAHSFDEAAKIFLDHPHFAIFPGDGVEVIECLDTNRAGLN